MGLKEKKSRGGKKKQKSEMVVALLNPSSSSSSALICRSLDLQCPSSSSYGGSLFFIKLPLKSTLKHLRLLQCNVIKTSATQTESGILFVPLFEQIGIAESGTKTLLEDNPYLRLSSFQSVRTRIRSLQSLGITGILLSSLVMKQPDTLTAPEIDSLICFFRDDLEGKIEPLQIKRLLSAAQPALLSGFQAKVKLLLQYGIPQANLADVLNKINPMKALCLKSSQDIKNIFAFLDRFGGVDLILKRPAILDYNLESQLIPRIGFLLDLSGGNEVATATVLRKLPSILAYTPEHLEDHVEFLKVFAGLTKEEVFKIILVYPNVFSASRTRKLEPRIGFLKECGLSSSEIYKFLMRGPLYLSLSFKVNLAHKLVLLVKLGYENNTKELAAAMGAVTRCSCKNMQEVISLFLNYGLTPEEILAMSKKHPQVLQYNSLSLDEKMDYLVEDMGREVRELLSFPAFLGYNFDGRIKKRYEVKKKLSGDGMSLNKLLSVSSKTFSTKKKRLLELHKGVE